MKPAVFIQTNHRQWIGALVSAYSLRRNSRSADEFEVRIMHHKDYPLLRRANDRNFLLRGEPNLVITTACRPTLQSLNKAAESTDWPASPTWQGQYPISRVSVAA